MLPEAEIPFRIVSGRVVPGFLDASDVPWLRVLVNEIDRFRGKPVRDLLDRLRQPLPCHTPPFKVRAAKALLLRLWKGQLGPGLDPGRIREEVFTMAAAGSTSRDLALESVARSLAVDPIAIERLLFADLPGERLVCGPAEIPSAPELVLRTNLLIARSLLFHARRVRIEGAGSIRPLVRQAKLRGLICNVIAPAAATDDARPVLELSGPFTVFRHTLLYGRALGELVQFLPHVSRFHLRAHCVLRDQVATLELESGDAIFPNAAPRPFDSKLEARFAKDFLAAAPDWDLLREPEPVPAAGTIIFPDFSIRHRLHPERTFLVEIVGYWSADYLRRKLALLREARLDRLILCIDEERGCDDDDLPAGARIVRFRRRIDVHAVLAAAR